MLSEKENLFKEKLNYLKSIELDKEQPLRRTHSKLNIRSWLIQKVSTPHW